MKLLIIYGTTEGQTRKICEFLQEEAKSKGFDVTLADASEPETAPSPKEYDAVIVAASVHMGEYQSSIKHYVTEHHKLLNRIPGLFLSVSLTAATDEPESWKELKEITQDFIRKTEWQPTLTEQVAGALRYTKYNFFKKFIMRLIAKKSGGDTDTSQDFEYTDWDQIRRALSRLEKKVLAIAKAGSKTT